MTVQIRRATTDDLSAFLELHAHVHDLHLQYRPDQFKQTEKSAIEARFREGLSSATTKIWVAELAGKFVGYAFEIQYQRAEGPYCPARRWCDIDQIGVDPAHRRARVATALMQAIVDSSHAAGIHEIELNSWAFNQDAHRAFESFGFTPKAIRFELKK
jgi:ribosomal protein S18 acetylase RimI-like enzyme